jgi:hypothetical protein
MSFKFNFRIGTKLALSAGVGVVLVGVMLASQIMGGSSVATSYEDANAQRRLSQIATDIKASVRSMTLGVRDQRLAQTADDSQKAASFTQASEESVLKFADEALKIIHLPENRQRAEKVKALATTYLAVGREIAATKAEMFQITVRRQENGDAWRKGFGAMSKTLETTKSAKSAEIGNALRDAAALFDNARTAGWRYAATGESAQIARTIESTDKTLAQLQKLRAEADDKTVTAGIEGMSAVVSDFKSIMNRYVELSQKVVALVRDKGLPTAGEMK